MQFSTCQGRRTKAMLREGAFKVDHEGHFWHSRFLHTIICAFLGYMAPKFVKKLDVTQFKQPRRSEGFDRKSHPRPF